MPCARVRLKNLPAVPTLAYRAAAAAISAPWLRVAQATCTKPCGSRIATSPAARLATAGARACWIPAGPGACFMLPASSSLRECTTDRRRGRSGAASCARSPELTAERQLGRGADNWRRRSAGHCRRWACPGLRAATARICVMVSARDGPASMDASSAPHHCSSSMSGGPAQARVVNKVERFFPYLSPQN